MKIIAGPCQHESFNQSLEIAIECKRVCDKYGIDYYFKSSFDKANRTWMSANHSDRGVGFRETMYDFDRIKQDLDVKTVTDFHDVNQITDMMFDFPHSVDVVQIPAFLCRQSDLISQACLSGKIVNIKKGQFLAPWDVAGILSKTKAASEVWITERGTSFGYNNLVVDFNGIQYMLDNYDVPLVFDATHSVQKPSASGSASGGNRDYVPGLTRAAAALGISNFFLEVHPDPDNAPCDGPNMLKLEDFEKVIHDIHSYSYSSSF